MRIFRSITGVLTGAGLLCATPAWADRPGDAEKLRRLDIMLMVTGLRCRTTGDNFQGDYARFTSSHLAELNAASDTLKTDLAAQHGAAGAARALDRLSVSMANAYGQGHPWLDCHQLKQATAALADARGTEPLLAAAEQLLSPSGSARLALLHR